MVTVRIAAHVPPPNTDPAGEPRRADTDSVWHKQRGPRVTQVTTEGCAFSSGTPSVSRGPERVLTNAPKPVMRPPREAK